MAGPISAAAVAALADEVIDWRFKGLPASWWGRTNADICEQAPDLFEGTRGIAGSAGGSGIAGSAGGSGIAGSAGGAVGPVCVLRADALTHNLTAMAGWCHERGVELAPHGKSAPTAPLGCVTWCSPTSWSMGPDCAGWQPN